VAAAGSALSPGRERDAGARRLARVRIRLTVATAHRRVIGSAHTGVPEIAAAGLVRGAALVFDQEEAVLAVGTGRALQTAANFFAALACGGIHLDGGVAGLGVVDWTAVARAP